jgi:pseudaminic acid cytidylyltransferase
MSSSGTNSLAALAPVAIIPARGGSKRIPQKNIRSFAGKPIIAYSIQVALRSGLFSRVIVSTDSMEIADVARVHGAEVPFMRPAELADDYTGTPPVLLHALDMLESANICPQYYCCIYATAPFIHPRYLKLGYDILSVRKASTVFSVTSFPYPIFRALKVLPDGRLEMVWPEHRTSRSQDLPETFHDAGQFYWGSVKALREEKKLYTADSYPVFLPRHLVQDIDTLEDWHTAERMFLSSDEEENS